MSRKSNIFKHRIEKLLGNEAHKIKEFVCMFQIHDFNQF